MYILPYQTQELFDLHTYEFRSHPDPKKYPCPKFEKKETWFSYFADLFWKVLGYEIEKEPNYDFVPWNCMEIHAINNQPLLYTNEISVCIVLFAKGYDLSGKLTHIGLAHQATWGKDLHKKFFEEMRQKVGEGKIEVSAVGGSGMDKNKDIQDEYETIVEEAKKHNITIYNRLNRGFYTYYITNPQECVKETGIKYAWFGKNHQPAVQYDAR